MKRIDQVTGTFDQNKEKRHTAPSEATIRRLPTYYRLLGRLIAEGTLRISSRALAERMGMTASQLRQDLSCFGDFGQQGYGYNVRYLYHKLSRILGMASGYRAVLVGTGDAARSFLAAPVIARGDVRICAAFGDTAAGELPLYPLSQMAELLPSLQADFAILATPPTQAKSCLAILSEAGIRGVLNYTQVPLTAPSPDMKIQNVYLDDPCLLLCYQLGCTGENED